MDVATLTQLIGSLGFPIVMCVLMWSRMDKQEQMHKEEMSKLTESLNNNTVALTQLTARLEGRGDVN